MLEPNDRRHLLESLRPPSGYDLDCAIGTTFSLDLQALLTLPLAFALFDWENEAGRPVTEPLALLEALRRYATRIHIFCQAGQISIPKPDQLLFSYLESCVFPVKATGDGVFHPKLWILRFTARKEPALYRLLCLSRNLTYDKSWDTVLVLEGEKVNRKNAFGPNHPLGNFVKALPDLALHKPPAEVRANIARVQKELRYVRFEPPNGFESVRFWPLGIPGVRQWPFEGKYNRMLVCSPFVSKDCLADLAAQDARNVLISRPDSLNELDRKALRHYKSIYTLDPDADLEYDESEGSEAEIDDSLNGLHAKLYIADAGWRSRIWTGSANATDAAFSMNVEFLVELVGRKSRCGIDAFLSQPKGQASFAGMLQEFLADKAPRSIDSAQQRLEHQADHLRRSLATAGLAAQILLADEPDRYHVELRLPKGSKFSLPAGAALRCWPITWRESAAIAVDGPARALVTFASLSFEALTSFYAFELTITKGKRQTARRFVLSLPVEGIPSGRQERILRALLQNREQVLLLLLLILTDKNTDVHQLFTRERTSALNGLMGRPNGIGTTLLEALIKALAHDPKKLDPIARLVEDLHSSDAQQLLPEGFAQIWGPIWTARQRMVS